jgi:hypothetical protein
MNAEAGSQWENPFVFHIRHDLETRGSTPVPNTAGAAATNALRFPNLIAAAITVAAGLV